MIASALAVAKGCDLMRASQIAPRRWVLNLDLTLHKRSVTNALLWRCLFVGIVQ